MRTNLPTYCPARRGFVLKNVFTLAVGTLAAVRPRQVDPQDDQTEPHHRGQDRRVQVTARR